MKNASHRASDTRRGTDAGRSAIAHPSLFNLENIPIALRTLPRWITWHYQARNGKSSKMPTQRVNDPNAWLLFDDAVARVAGGRGRGVGFVLGGGIVGIDIDNCVASDGTMHEIARDALALRSYSERSPSGHGLHVLIRGTIMNSQNIRTQNGVPGHEIYDGRRRSARYFTVTGDRLGDASEIREGPLAQTALDAFVAKWFREKRHAADRDVGAGDEQQLNDERILQLMLEATDGAKWRAAFDGDHSGYPSQSEADYALIRKLRFYSQGNVQQMDRLFRRSGLMRQKWDEKHGTQTYGELTIRKAVAQGGRLYEARGQFRGGVSAGQYGVVHKSVLPVLGSLTPTDVLIYVALAIHANGNGECYPSAAALAKLVGTTREHAQNSVSSLVAAGLVLQRARPGATSIFRLTAFLRVSDFDTGRGHTYAGILHGTQESPKTPHNVPPVSKSGTPPVSNFDTRTDKEQGIDTERGGQAA